MANGKITRDDFFDFIEKANGCGEQLYKKTNNGVGDFEEAAVQTNSKNDSVNINGADVDMKHNSYETYDDGTYEGVEYKSVGFASHPFPPGGIIAKKKK